MKKIHVVEKDGSLYFHRLTLNQRIQHMVMFISFTVLAITGLPLKFHHLHWGEILYNLVGGIAFAPVIHRISAVIMTAVFVYHFLYVVVCAWKYYLMPLRQEGTLSFKTGIKALSQLPMVPNLTDLSELSATMKYFFFITNERPSLVAHGLKEKFGYLAVFWGVPVIGMSGFFLWGESFFTKFFTGNVLNFAYIAHSDEAFLASIVIFIWHIYNVHLTPAVFPMGKAWLNGYIGEREMMQYHYEDYITAMKSAGIESRTRPLNQGFADESGVLKKAFMKIYLPIMFLAVIVSTYYICKVIYESVFVFGYQVVTTEPTPEVEDIIEPEFLEEIILSNKTEKTFFRGYRLTYEKKIKNHFHRIEMEIALDSTSHCIKCHGDLPHGSSPHLRAFLNMHNLYFACQTCHVRPKEGKSLNYYWYNPSTGEIVFKPEIGNQPIDSLGIKLSPYAGTGMENELAYIKNERALAAKQLKILQSENLDSDEKIKIIEQIHEYIAEKPVLCKECHQRKNPFLPLEEAGYPKNRISSVANDQITKMINEYKELHTPLFLEWDK